MSTAEELKALKQKHAAEFWRHPEVCGIDIEDDAGGKPIFAVHLKTDNPAIRKLLPAEIEGRQVRYYLNPIEKQ